MGASKATLCVLAALQAGVLLSVACGGKAGSDRGGRAEVRVPAPPAPDAGPTYEPGIIPRPPLDRPPPVVDAKPYDDPGCPPPPPSADQQLCDPLGEESGCSPDQACYPYVIYPMGPCDVERYGSWCAPAGSGLQGEECSRGGCAAGFICVSTGEGTECVRLCGLTAEQSVCAQGLLCLPIDIEGFGGCL